MESVELPSSLSFFVVYKVNEFSIGHYLNRNELGLGVLTSVKSEERTITPALRPVWSAAENQSENMRLLYTSFSKIWLDLKKFVTFGKLKNDRLLF